MRPLRRRPADSRRRPGDLPSFDEVDRQILDLLQQGDRPVAVLAEEVGLSQTPCWRRVRRLEEAGVISGRVALVDPRLAGLPIVIFVAVTALRHEIGWLTQFRELVDSIPEIVEAYRLTGPTDYILKVLVPDIDAFDDVYRRMVERLEFTQITSSIAMEEMKYTTAVPTGYLVPAEAAGGEA